MPAQPNRMHDESDNESINDLLSPSDGYFAEGHTHPGDVLVPDPSQGSTRLDKEREAREELQSSPSNPTNRRPQIDTSSATQATSSRPVEVQPQAQEVTIATSPRRQNHGHSSNIANETTPLISSAPPAYSPPEPGSPYHQHMRNGSVPGIHETIDRPNALFPQSRQDMGGEAEALLSTDKDRRRWTDRIHDWWEENSYKVFKYIALFLALLAAIGFLADLFIEISNGTKGRHNPENLPDSNEIPSYCKIIGQGHVDFRWEQSRYWKLLQVTKQPLSEPHNYHVQTIGKIHLRNAPEDAVDDIKTDLQYYYSSASVAGEMEFSSEDNMLKIVTAGSVQNYNDPTNWRPCLYLNLTVWVKPGLKQESFSLGTATLSVDIASNYTAQAREWTIGSAVGSVKSHADANGESHWGGRNIKIVTDSASIDGAFPLYDSLWLETSAGHVNADLTLHTGQYGSESSAALTLMSSAGSIRADTPVLAEIESGRGNKTVDSVPKRKYSTNVVARAGSVRLNLVQGVSTFIKSHAGSITAALTPWQEPWRESMITIESNSGGVDVTVKDSLPYKGEALKKLSGSYRFDSGHLSLRYPAEWQGHIQGDLLTGGLDIDWPGLQILKRVRQGVYNHLEAKKGDASAYVQFKGASGSASLMGKGGSKYPSDDGTGGGGDHRKVIDDRDEEHDSWPIFIPPLSRKTMA